MTLKTRKPTGRVPWPLVLVEGGEKSGKSWAAAVLSASQRVGRTFWIDLGEGAGDEYGAIPGVRYEVVEHDGTWHSILHSVEEIRTLAAQAAEAGEPPVVVVIDSMTQVWEMLKDWTTNRAKSTPTSKKALKEDPNAEITVTANFWNDANARHRRLMTLLMTFPGIAVVTARGKEVTAMTNGQPDPRKPKEYRVEGHKDLAFDATVWLRLSRTEHPLIVGARSVHAGIVPGEDRPHRKPDLTLEALVFDVLKCNPAQAYTRDLVAPNPGAEAPTFESSRALALSVAVGEAPDQAALRTLWSATGQALRANEISQAEADRIADAISAAKAEMDKTAPAQPTTGPAPGGVTEQQHRRMHALWRELRLGGEEHRERRLATTAEILGLPEPLESSASLTAEQADLVIAALEQRVRELADVVPTVNGAAA